MSKQTDSTSLPAESRISYNTLQLANQALGATGASSSLLQQQDAAGTNGIGYLDYFDYDSNNYNPGQQSLNTNNLNSMYLNMVGQNSQAALGSQAGSLNSLVGQNNAYLGRRNGLLGQGSGGVNQRMKSAQSNIYGLTGGSGLGSVGLSGLGGLGGGLGGGIGRTGYGGGSGYGGPVSFVSGYGPNTQCEQGINPLLALLTLAGAVVGFYFIYIKLTMSGGRRSLSSKTVLEDVLDMTWIGIQ